jgi:hypothetical protein
MSLDDGMTDGQADSHTLILCRIEGFEESVRSLGFETDPYIFHAKPHPIPFLSFGSDQ